MRTPIPDDISAEVMFQHDRTCCVCCEPGKAVQIHHIDENPTNHDLDNLAVLCLQHHEETQVRGGFGRKLRAPEIRRHREDWLRRVAMRRSDADKIILERTTAIPPTINAGPWSSPSDEALATILNTLPDIYADIYKRAAPLLGSVLRNDMLRGLVMIMDVFEQSWLRLAAWFPPRHFGGIRADEYFNKFRFDRYDYHLAMWEPEGPGSGGREAAIYASMDTLEDLERDLVETVRKLGLKLESFDFDKWRDRWNSVWDQRLQ